jgi:hypothetical protein
VADNWHIVDDSHKDGLCYNVNALLSDAIAEALKSGNLDRASAETSVHVTSLRKRSPMLTIVRP